MAKKKSAAQKAARSQENVPSKRAAQVDRGYLAPGHRAVPGAHRKRIKELEGKRRCRRSPADDDTLERLEDGAGDTGGYLLSHDDGSRSRRCATARAGVRSASGARRISSPTGEAARSSPATTPPAPSVEVPPKACDLLTACDDWTKLDDLERAGFVSSSTFAATIDRMVELALLERSDRPRRSPRQRDGHAPALEPAGRLLPRHHQGRAVRVADGRSRAAARARRRRPRLLLPAIKRYAGLETIDLPRPDA